MNKSESIKNLAAALSKAQGNLNAHDESKILHKLFHRPGKYKRNHTNSPSDLIKFYEKVCWGSSSCWYWTATRDGGGYGVLGKNKAHRISWALHNGPIPAGKMVLHKCDVPGCVNPEHLFLGNQADNMRDMISKNRHHFPTPKHGEFNPMAKLTSDDVLKMRAVRLETGFSYKKIARMFGVSTMTAYRAVTEQLWKVL